MTDVLNEAETIATAAAPIVAAADPALAPFAAAVPAAEAAVNTVVAEAPHQTALTDVVNALNVAGPLVQAVSPQAGVAMESMSALIAFFKSIL